ncbi:hypothetical protein SADUNF_Sadunf05G0191000 [Salix dunnii]|uniref:Uncharacterized protein n=1 Tax=Salix dunnii TaxID=1413687 RepID=A0A835K5Y8_9ROSI|nr:hypothetical protein SADUNF_Sadunf05G0191000 [Salix dunnii]
MSETLTHFYPLAGKIKDELSTDSNDEGAYYMETQVNCHLSEFLRKPDLLLGNQLFPCDLLPTESTAVTYVANFQVNVFECGGIAICICISHRIVDGAALSTCIKAWSATAKGSKEAIMYPEFFSSSLFPANDMGIRDSAIVMFGSLLKKGQCMAKRFVFDASAISNLKAQTASLGVKCPTRIELQNTQISPKPGLEDLVGEVRKAISEIDSDFVENIKGGKGNAQMDETLKGIGAFDSRDVVDYLGFSSCCKFSFYDFDFGWGNPVWVSSFGLSCSLTLNLIFLVDTRCDSIEAFCDFG